MPIRTLIEAARQACAVQCPSCMTDTSTLAVLIEWQDGRTLVLSLAQLSDTPPDRLAGAVIRLVSWCICCGSLVEPTKEGDMSHQMRSRRREVRQ
jgi:hypothetical protein